METIDQFDQKMVEFSQGLLVMKDYVREQLRRVHSPKAENSSSIIVV